MGVVTGRLAQQGVVIHSREGNDPSHRIQNDHPALKGMKISAPAQESGILGR